jgi:enoyl-CoA hydratase/carnithine racemase
MAILFEKRNHIAYLTINRPEKLNSVDLVTRGEMEDALADFNDDDEMWTLIVTGAGDKAFSAGGDLKEWNAVNAAGKDPGNRTNTTPDSAKITIAAINGIAIGGGFERTLRCDFRVAADHARMRFSEVLIGLIPPYGVLRLPRLIQPAWAAEKMITGEWISAEEAYRVGLVNRVVPYGELLDSATQLAETINAAGPLAVRAVKEILYSTQDMTIEQASGYSEQVYRQLRASEDAKEGPRAFAEKRKPIFRGR